MDGNSLGNMDFRNLHKISFHFVYNVSRHQIDPLYEKTASYPVVYVGVYIKFCFLWYQMGFCTNLSYIADFSAFSTSLSPLSPNNYYITQKYPSAVVFAEVYYIGPLKKRNNYKHPLPISVLWPRFFFSFLRSLCPWNRAYKNPKINCEK